MSICLPLGNFRGRKAKHTTVWLACHIGLLVPDENSVYAKTALVCKTKTILLSQLCASILQSLLSVNLYFTLLLSALSSISSILMFLAFKELRISSFWNKKKRDYDWVDCKYG